MRLLNHITIMPNPPEPTLAETQAAIAQVCDSIKEMLLAKNMAYGNSAICPVRIFSQSPALEQINVRIDDKLSRLAKGHAAGEDVEKDLLGYLVLKQVCLLLSVPKQPDTDDL